MMVYWHGLLYADYDRSFITKIDKFLKISYRQISTNTLNLIEEWSSMKVENKVKWSDFL